MSVRVRLTRVGSKKNPIWRVVVADQRSPRDGRFIETIGHYNPQTEPSTIVLDKERLDHWLARGAQPSRSVKQLVKAHAKGLEADPKTSAAIAAATPAVAPPLHTEPATPPSERPEKDVEAPAEQAEAAEAEGGVDEVAKAEAATEAEPEAADAADAEPPESAPETEAAAGEEPPVGESDTEAGEGEPSQ